MKIKDFRDGTVILFCIDNQTNKSNNKESPGNRLLSLNEDIHFIVEPGTPKSPHTHFCRETGYGKWGNERTRPSVQTLMETIESNPSKNPGN